MRHYFDTLKKKLKKEPPFTFDTLMKSYYRCFKVGFLSALGLLTIVLKVPDVFGATQLEVEIVHRMQCLLDDTIATL